MRKLLHFAAFLVVVCACTPPTTQAPPPRDAAAELEDVNACGYVSCRGPFHTANELDFGIIPMGAALPNIPANAACNQARLQNHAPGRMCSLTMDGVTYLALDGVVVGKEIDVTQERASALPFGLNTDQTIEDALAAMRQHTDAPMSIKAFPEGGARYISNDDVLKNGHDRPFLFTLLFVHDRLARIMLRDPSAPTD